MRNYPNEIWQRLEKVFDAPFGQALNPWHHLGAITFFLFWTVTVSGVYLYIFYRTGVQEAYQSVEDLTHGQWYAGGVMRSMHRYASDGMVVTMLLHMLRNFVSGRFYGYRWFSWVSGVPLIWLVYTSGINGYWLVWDKLAQFVAIATADWFGWLPLFSEPLERNFLYQESVTGRFFTLLSFAHVTIPLVLLLLMWVHTKRINRAETNPPLRLGIGVTVMLLVLSLVKPALSQGGPADLMQAPGALGLDWFYLIPFPVLYHWSPGALWLLVGGITLLLTATPWLFKPRGHVPVVEVHLDNCNGCSRCFDDCPYSAIVMQPRQDGAPYALQPLVDPNLCASCGICVGACPYSMPFRSDHFVSGLELPQLPLAGLRDETDSALSALQGDARIMVFGCHSAFDVSTLKSEGVAALSLPCIGMLPPAFIDYVLRDSRANGALIAGCRDCDCQYRLGINWTKQRIERQREPHLRQRVPQERIEQCWAGRQDAEEMKAALATLRARVENREGTRD